MSNRDFTPVQEVLLAAIKVASLRFQARESTLLRRELEELADRLDEWFVSHQPLREIDITRLANGIRLAAAKGVPRTVQPNESFPPIRVIGKRNDGGQS